MKTSGDYKGIQWRLLWSGSVEDVDDGLKATLKGKIPAGYKAVWGSGKKAPFNTTGVYVIISQSAFDDKASHDAIKTFVAQALNRQLHVEETAKSSDSMDIDTEE